MTNNDILSRLPYTKPFLFVDELLRVDENGAEGTFTLDPKLDFFNGHFKDYPVTPGVILTEIMAQIGLVALGIFLLNDVLNSKPLIALTSSNVEFFKAVYPGETVRIVSKKQYFRFGKLKCDVQMFNERNDEVCSGQLSGMIVSENGK